MQEINTTNIILKKQYHIQMKYLACPLYMNQISWSDVQSVRMEVIFHCWVCLYNVSSLSSHVQIKYSVRRCEGGCSWTYQKHMTSVLENSASLVGIYVHTQCCPTSNINVWVLFNNGLNQWISIKKKSSFNFQQLKTINTLIFSMQNFD